MHEYYGKIMLLKHYQSNKNSILKSFLPLLVSMKKKFFISVVTSIFLFMQAAYAGDVASFVVEVSPKNLKVNQAADLTIKAVDANGAVVKDYNSTVYMSVLEIKDLQDAVLPNDNIYEFSAKDQWQITFSKWFILKTPWSYTVKVEDFNNENIVWQANVEVSASSVQWVENAITFSSPIKNGTETSSTVTVVWNAWVKNAKVQIILDGVKVKEETSNSQGDFSSFLTLLSPWAHILEAKVSDIDGKILAQSESHPFTYQPQQWWSIQSIEVLPSKTLKQWQKATFVVKVWWDVTAIELTLRDETWKESKLQLDKTSEWTFQKQLLMDVAGVYTIDATYNAGVENKSQPAITTISVLEWKWIKEVVYIVDPLDKTKLNLAWKPIWEVEYVLVKKWLKKDSLEWSDVLTWSTWSIVWFDVSKEWYYIRLFPSDSKWEIIGEPSDIIMIEQVQWSAPVCRVQWIQV